MWVNPSLSLAICFKPLGLRLWLVLFVEGFMNPNNVSWKAPEFVIFETKILELIRVEATKESLKIIMFSIKGPFARPRQFPMNSTFYFTLKAHSQV